VKDYAREKNHVNYQSSDGYKIKKGISVNVGEGVEGGNEDGTMSGTITVSAEQRQEYKKVE